MRVFFLVLFLNFIWTCLCEDIKDKPDRYLIACHTTDFKCFKRQYKALRDNVLLGNDRLNIQHFEPYVFKYGNTGTCIKLTGWEESELTGVQLDSITKEFSWTLELPFKIQQVKSDTITCSKPENEFKVVGNQFGTLKRFTGNATIQVIYPFELRKKKNDIFMVLKEENLDVILDIPDLSYYNKDSNFEKNLYDISEWAYSVVQHIDAAQHFALPFTKTFRVVSELIPIDKLILLYPDEDYARIQIKYMDSPSKCTEKIV